MRRQDYFRQERQGWLRLHEKGGTRHDVPAHHRAAEALDDYLEAAGLDEPTAALFQSVDPAGRRLTGRTLSRRLVLAMIKRLAAAADPTVRGLLSRAEEALDHAAAQLRQSLEADLLDRVRAAPSAFLERVVVDLLIAMGYGGGDTARGRVTGQAGDGGIDGTIREDALGLDEVYLQAKKYAAGTTVGEGDLRNFAGAIDAANTTKGVFVTTAGFTRSATDYVAKSPKRIVLIDGEELARLMVVHEIGVRTRIRYAVKRIDEDYFAGEDL